jgi:FkbM family methyltransferase
MRDLARSVVRTLWEKRAALAAIPGAYQGFNWATTRFGEGRVYTMRFGAMRGFRWRRYARLTYWYHLGLYEPHVSGLLEAHLRPGDTIWDIGANAGYHTLLASRIVGPRGKVVAFEPAPETAAITRDQLALNQVRNCEVIEAAIGDVDGTVIFHRMPNLLLSGIGVTGEGAESIEVEAITLDTLLDRLGWPDVIKMDIEGAERIALPRAERLLSGPRRPRLLLSTHGPDIDAWCRDFLRQRGYDIEAQSGHEQMLIALPRD